MGQNDKVSIDFDKLGGPLYAGRDRGELAREKLQLDALDKKDTEVDVSVPEHTYTVTSSFFLGLFGDSVRAAGSSEKFFHRFHFNAPKRMIVKFRDYADRALREKKPLI
jgi:hypothetical protein